MRIKINSNFYNVEFVDELKDENGNEVWGLLLPDVHKFLINNKISPENKFDTILHEVIHSILQDARIDKYIKKNKYEDFVDMLMVWLKMFLENNNLEEIKREL